MLSSEFTQEMGALIRRLETRVRLDPDLMREDSLEEAQAVVEEAIVILCALYLKLDRTTRGG